MADCTNKAPSLQIKSYYLFETIYAQQTLGWHADCKLTAQRTPYGHMQKRRRLEISEMSLAHISPLGWEHILLIGQNIWNK